MGMQMTYDALPTASQGECSMRARRKELVITPYLEGQDTRKGFCWEGARVLSSLRVFMLRRSS